MMMVGWLLVRGGGRLPPSPLLEASLIAGLIRRDKPDPVISHTADIFNVIMSACNKSETRTFLGETDTSRCPRHL